jgi:hypothetical protein
MTITHTKVSGKSDGVDATLVQPSDWNAGHTINGIPGVTTNSNATVGDVGEYVEANASNITVNSGTAVNIASISLTAGDWDVTLIGDYSGQGGGTTINFGSSSISTVANTSNASTRDRYVSIPNFVLVQDMGFSVPSFRMSLASTTTVYGVAALNSSGTAALVGGSIHARRVR